MGKSFKRIFDLANNHVQLGIEFPKIHFYTS